MEILSVWLPKNGRALVAAFARFNCVFKTLSHGSFEQAALILLSSDKAIQAVSHKVAQALLKELKCVKDSTFGAGSAPIASFVNSVFGDVAFLKLGLHAPQEPAQAFAGANTGTRPTDAEAAKKNKTDENKEKGEKRNPDLDLFAETLQVEWAEWRRHCLQHVVHLGADARRPQKGKCCKDILRPSSAPLPSGTTRHGRTRSSGAC